MWVGRSVQYEFWSREERTVLQYICDLTTETWKTSRHRDCVVDVLLQMQPFAANKEPTRLDVA